MSYKIKCHDCDELIYSNSKKCVKCGWINKTITESIPDVMVRCAHLDCEKRGLKDLKRVNEKEYLCELHWDELILKNQDNQFYQIQAQRILLTRQFFQEAKDLGISNYEYFKKNCSEWRGVKDALISRVEGCSSEIS